MELGPSLCSSARNLRSSGLRPRDDPQVVMARGQRFGPRDARMVPLPHCGDRAPRYRGSGDRAPRYRVGAAGSSYAASLACARS